jgi:basic amino acid/polyamine antiporter, APA family
MADDGGLQRDLGLADIVLFGVGGIVGAGIYAIIGEAAGYGGTLLWVSFLMAALVAFLTAGSYAELVSRFPDAGGSFEYVKQAFGIRWAAVASVAMLFTGIVAAGAIAISFSSYLSRLLDVGTVWTTIAVIAAMGALNALGAAQASWFNAAATVVTLAGLAAVVVVALPDIRSTDLLDAADTTPLSLGIGGALIFFSFIGFEDLVKLAEETRDPRRTLPRGMLIAAAIVLVVYLAVAIAAVSALGSERLSESPGPLAEIMQVKAGSAWSTVIVIVALFATSKAILSNLLGASRLGFDVARDTGVGWLRTLTRINRSTRTPVIAIVLVTAAAIGFGAIGNLGAVAAVGNVLIMIVFLTVNAALLAIRRRETEQPPFVLPWTIGPYPVTTIGAIAGVAVLLVLNLLALFGIGRPV